jgi:predicted negative regulator of RcsB-dependent stress response
VIIATQPTVEVVTAGTDWAAIVAAIVTGMAAIFGIAGTAWQASRARQAATADLKTSIDAATSNQQANIEAAAENLRTSNDAGDRRALRAEKIRVYSDFQSEIDNMLTPAAGRTKETITAIYRSAAAVILIAPENIGALARNLARQAEKVRTSAVTTEPVSIDTIRGPREELYELMRADIGVDRD